MLKKFSKLANQTFWQMRAFGLSPGRLHLRLGFSKPKCSGVICTSIPKAGTNLLLRSVCLHPQFYRVVRRTLTDQNCDDPKTFDDALATLSGGQVLSSHLRHTPERENAIREQSVKHLFIVRDPRDVVISYAHYAAKDPTHYLRSVFEKISNVEDRIKLLIQGDPAIDLQPVGARYLESKGWLNSAHVVRFEDVVTQGNGDQRRAVVSDMLDYLVGERDPHQVQQISSQLVSSQTRTFRKGESGEWKTVFTPELVELFKTTAGQQLIDFGYEKDLDWSA